MKKTFSRAFSLLLVLALLVSVIPSALAATYENALAITGGNSVTVGDNGITLQAALSNSAPQGATLEGATWSWTGDESKVTVTGSSSQATVSAKDSVKETVEATISVTATVPGADGAENTIYKGSITIDVNPAATPEPETKPTLVVTASPATVEVEGTVTLTASFVDGDDKPVQVTDPQITWSYSGDVVELPETKDGTSITVTAKKAGTASVTATCTAAENGSDSADITVNKKALTATISGDATMKVGDKKDYSVSLGADYDETLKPTLSNWTVEADSSNQGVITVDSTGEVTALKAGTAKVKVTATLVNDNYTLKAADGSSNTTVTIEKTITVNAASFSLSKDVVSIAGDGSGSAVVTASFTDSQLPNGVDEDDITYTVDTENKTYASVNAKVEGSKITIYDGDGQGTVVVTVKAWNGTGSQAQLLGSQEITVGVYQEYVIRGTVASGTPTFELDDPVFTTLTLDGKNVPTKALSNALIGGYNYYEVSWQKSSTLLTFTKDGKTATSAVLDTLPSVKVTLNGTAGTATITYTWKSKEEATVAKYTAYITVGESEGDIVYNTTYDKKVIFDASDFTDFWNDMKKAGKVTGSMSYVQFNDINTGLYPKYGKLYRDTSCSNQVLTSYKFTTTSTAGYYLLDNVTYKPDETIKTATTVLIPFTAYGSTTSNNAIGIIEININRATTTITSYGVGFGNGTTSIADTIAAAFKQETGEVLSYVTFPAISTSTGKLFYDFSGVLNSRQVLSTNKFYYNGAKTDLDLDDVVFVPRAGLYGEVTLYYKAYNAGASKSYSGTIVLNVQQKTKSAEFSDVGTSYSWAADSVDFLNYEGVAQGSNGKYRPTANITRGDFMLMLYRAFLEDEHKNDSITSNFSDVTKGSDTYSKETYQAVGVAKKLGIAQGTNGKFNPKSYITRQEAMTLIYRTLDEVNYDLEYTVSTSTSSFKDYSSVASYAKTAISDLIGHGIVIGNNSKINPTSNITRAEMAVILHRVLTY